MRNQQLLKMRFKGSAFRVCKANRRTAEFRISNAEGRFRFAQSFFIKQIEFIPSIFDIHNSTFDIRSYKPLNPEPLILTPQGFTIKLVDSIWNTNIALEASRVFKDTDSAFSENRSS